METMKYKGFSWPHNPEKLKLDYRRDPQYGEDAQGLPVYIGMGQRRCIVSGSGVFTGELAIETFEELEVLFRESTGGILFLPHGDSFQAYFSQLTVEQDSREQYIHYSFTFLGTDEKGAIPV